MFDERDEQQSLEIAVWLTLRDLEELFARHPSRLDEPIESLRASLKRALPEPRASPRGAWSDKVFAAILFQFDERELDKGRGLPCADVSLLQTRYANTRDGGELFYEYLESALRSRATPQLVLQLFLYCMKSGFCGRYPNLEDPERLSALQELIGRVCPPRTAPIKAPPSTTPTSLIEGRRFPYWNYAIAAFTLFVLWSGLHVAASIHQVHLVGMTHCEDP